MFNKKDKNIEKNTEREINKENEEKKALDERIEKEIQIHSMPQKFKQEKEKASQSKTLGLIIVIGGAIFMAAIAIAMYYYLFVMPNQVKEAPKTQVTQEKEPETQIQVETETNQAEEELEAVEPKPEATTTVEIIEEATTTEELEAAEPDEELGDMRDSDGDGLTDLEEELLGSDINDNDTDGDGYKDLSEVLNLYDPISPGKLKDNPNIKTSNANVEYEVLYPDNWAENYFDDSLILNSPRGHIINIGVQPNADFMSAEDWYLEFVNDTEISDDQKITRDTWDGIRSDNGFQVYLTDKERRYIIVISYTSPAEDSGPVYKNIYEMIINSFVVR